MLTPLFGLVAGYSLREVLIAIAVVGAALGILYLALQYFEIRVPPVIVKIFWIIVVLIVAVVAINIAFSL